MAKQAKSPAKGRAKRKAERWGYIDRDGKVAIPFQFEFAAPFSEGLAEVKIEGKHGCIDLTGKLAIPARFGGLGDCHDGILTAYVDGKFGLIDRTGTFTVPPIYDNIGNYRDGLAQFRTGKLIGYLDRTGKVAIPPRFQHAEKFSGGFALVHDPNEFSKLWFIDTQGKYAFGPFIGAYRFSESWASVSDNTSNRFIDTRGRTMLELESHIHARLFSEDLCASQSSSELNDRHDTRLEGYINRQGKWVIPAQFDDAGWFQNGTAVVEIDEKYGLIDKTGRYIVPTIYDSLEAMSEKRIEFSLNDSCGFLDEKGKVVVEPVYSMARSFSQGLAAVCRKVEV